MASATNTPTFCGTRTYERHHEAQEESNIIRRPLLDKDAQRPYMIPLEIDPYDIWERILHCTSDAECVLAAWDACPMFRKILRCESKYFQARLPQIVKLILDKYPEYLVDKREEDRRRGGFIVEFGLIIKPVSPSRRTLLDLRLISKLCKNSVEGVLQTLDRRKICLRLETMAKIQDIIEAVREDQVMAHSFFPQNLELKEPQVWQHRFHEAVSTLLQLTERRTTTFCYGCWKRPSYEKLMEWVEYMPNLKNLELKTDARTSTLNARDRGVQRFENLSIFLECPKLQSLTLNHPRYLGAIVRRILEGNPQITSLKVQQMGFSVNESEDFIPNSEMHFMLPHLAYLRVPLFASLVRNLDFGVPLRELVLYRPHSSRHVTSSELFLFLNQFGDSLEHLELDFEVIDGTAETFLKLPHLKFFMWRYFGSFTNMKFLLGNRSLEKVHIKLVMFNAVHAKFILDTCSKNYRDSLTIWEAFPHLQKLLVVGHIQPWSMEICRP